MKHIGLLLNLILEDYFLNSRCLIVISSKNNQNPIKSPEIPIINVRVEETLKKELIFQHFGCQDIIILHENATWIFTEFERLIREAEERYNDRKYIVVTNKSHELFEEHRPVLKFVSNLLVIQPNLNTNEETYDLLTHSPHLNTIYLDKWYSSNQSFHFRNNLFPNKLMNQEGRVLEIGTLQYLPYSIISDDGRFFVGTETCFINEYAKRHNMTPNFTVIPGDNSWGDIFPNWTGTGLLGILTDDLVDVGFAALYSWDVYNNYLDYTQALTRSGVTAIVPAPKLTNGLLTPLLSFSVITWMLILIGFTINTLVFFLLLKKEGNNEHNFGYSVISMIKIMLLQQLTMRWNSKLMKYYLGLNLLYILLLSLAYSSGLSSIMTVPRYEKSIRNAHDLAERGLKWGAPSDVWVITLNEITDEKDFVTITKNFEVQPEEVLIQYSKENNFGFVVERLHYGNYAPGSYIKSDVISQYRIMPEDIYWNYCVLMARKSSVLLPSLNDLLLRWYEAGLSGYWEQYGVFNYMDKSVQQAIQYYKHHVQGEVFVKLKWVHVEGAFTILFIGHLLASLTFLYEILTKPKRKILNLTFIN